MQNTVNVFGSADFFLPTPGKGAKQKTRPFLPPLPTLASHWHLALPCNGKGASSLLVSGPASAVAAAVVAGRPGNPAPVATAAVASLPAAALPIACAYIPTKTCKPNKYLEAAWQLERYTASMVLRETTKGRHRYISSGNLSPNSKDVVTLRDQMDPGSCRC